MMGIDHIWKTALEAMASDMRVAIDGDMEVARTLYNRSKTSDDIMTFEEFLENLPSWLQDTERLLETY